ncbi:MAG: HD domain-containing protein [Oscillospiraceae bacterium]|jgi:HD-GYP domain-containing protein (c-di-GMP phosphodiesterase class II)|nr:HD domain-containing protein [Oscillospiraceae bacterium]
MDRNQFITAFAAAFDKISENTKYNFQNHCVRTAFIAVRLGELLKLPRTDLYDLYAYALLHDGGVSWHDSKFVNGTPEERLIAKKNHSENGEALIKDFPFITEHKDIIKYHHSNWDGSGPFGLSGNAIPVFSQIIHISHKAALLYAMRLTRKEVSDAIEIERNGKFSPTLCDAFAALTSNPGFWVSVSDSFINDTASYPIITDEKSQLSLEQLIPIAKIISAITDSKSAYTENYSASLGEKATVVADFYKYDDEHKTKITLAGYLLDIGKLSIPSSIEDKPGKLTDDEFATVKSHPYYTHLILSKIPGFEDITVWASNHHEKINGKGYPLGLGGDDLSEESRILAVLNVYQALIQPRSYRMSLPPEAIANIFNEEIANGNLDERITKDILSIFNK